MAEMERRNKRVKITVSGGVCVETRGCGGHPQVFNLWRV